MEPSPVEPVGPVSVVVSAGSILADRFRVEERVGTPGTIAFAVRAIDTLTGEDCICKIPRDTSPDKAGSILEQYLLLRRIASRRMPSVLGYFKFQFGSDTVPFLVMERAEGDTVEKWCGSASIRSRIQVLAEIAEAAADINDAGSAHGDVHLGNVIIGQQGRVMLIDPDSGAYGSSVAREIREDGAKEDIVGLRHCAEELLIGEESSFVKGVLERLRQVDVPRPSLREIAFSVRSVLSGPSLLADFDTPLTKAAESYKARQDSARRQHARNVNVRDMAFRQYRDLVAAAAEQFGLPATSNDDEPRGAPSLRPIANELRPENNHYVTRHVEVRTGDGDELCLQFEGPAGFRKPWPYPDRPGLLSNAWLSVVRKGDEQNGTLRNTLELVLSDGLVELFVSEPFRRRKLEEKDLARCFHVLVGDVYPGLVSPWRFDERPQPYVQVGDAGIYEGPFARLGIPRPASPDEFRTALMQMILSVPKESVGNGPVGSRFATVLEIGESRRGQLIREITAESIDVVAHMFRAIYRFDVVINPHEFTLAFDVDAATRQGEAFCMRRTVAYGKPAQ